MASIKLWYSPEACSLASHILLYETGTTFETVVLNVRKGFPDEFCHINPKKRVPVLSLDDQIVTETPAIMTTISQLAPEKKLLGKTNMETVRVYEWLNFLSGILHGQAFGGLFRPHRFSDDPNTFSSIKRKSRNTVRECFQMIESDLNSSHAVGDSLTVVDPFLYVFYRWGMSLRIKMQEDYPKFTKLAAAVAQRPSTQKALHAEGVEALVPKL